VPNFPIGFGTGRVELAFPVNCLDSTWKSLWTFIPYVLLFTQLAWEFWCFTQVFLMLFWVMLEIVITPACGVD